MLSKNFKEKNFVALELTLNGQKEAVDMTPVERTRKMINVSNVENEVTLLVIAEDVAAVVTVVQVADAEAGVAVEVEVEDMVVIGADLLVVEAMSEVVVEAEAGVVVEAVVDLPEERRIAEVVQEALVVLPVRVERMTRTTSTRAREHEKLLEKLLARLPETIIVPAAEAEVDRLLYHSQDRKAEVPVHRRKENDH